MSTHPEPSYQTDFEKSYEHEETRNLVALVKDAAELIRTKGETAFGDFATPGSRWYDKETYIFVLDSRGYMLVHPDRESKDKNVLDLKDVNGKPIIRGLINAATVSPDKPEGWYHYQWPEPGGLLPRWKSSYVRLVNSPSGNTYIVGSGMYNDRMERPFVVDAVKDAVVQIEKLGKTAFPLFYDPQGPFLAKDEYIFVYDMNGVNLVLPTFPNLEGRSLIDYKDTQGKQLIRAAIDLVEAQGSGWVDYMWPKPGESVSTQKSAYVTKAKMGDQWVLVGSGVYLENAPKVSPMTKTMTAQELMSLVREGASVLQKQGDQAYPEFRKTGSKWFHDGTYFFVWDMEGKRVFHAADPSGEGKNVSEIKDVLGRPIGKMILQGVKNPSGEGWIHYMYPQPGNVFPTWKSTFLKKVSFPSGIPHIVGCGIYNMEMDKTFIEDVVNRACSLISERGKSAFAELRDKTGPYYFMNTYVFVDTPEGIELMNPAFPSLEGKNLMEFKDPQGKPVVNESITAAMKEGSAWITNYWYRPGQNTLARKQSYVKKVQFGKETYIVGSGLYLED